MEVEIQGGISAIMAAILKFFFSEKHWNFEKLGVRLQNGVEVFHIRSKFGCFVQDFKAHCAVCDCKGAKGSNPCLHCKNMYYGDPDKVEGNEYIKHISVAKPAEFDKHTRDSFFAAADAIQTLAAEVLAVPGRKAALGRLEQAHGMKYNAHGIAFDPYCRTIFSPPMHSYCDWMHSTVGSGGVTQFEVNQYIIEASQYVSLDELDNFQKKICWPKKTSWKLGKNFFKQRVVQGEGQHIKAFASECLMVVTVCCLLGAIYLEPRGVMPEHIRCMNLMRAILDMFLTGDGAANHVDVLRRLLLEHHTLFVKLYGRRLSKTKMHLLYHIADYIELFKRLMSCLPTWFWTFVCFMKLPIRTSSFEHM